MPFPLEEFMPWHTVYTIIFYADVFESQAYADSPVAEAANSNLSSFLFLICTSTKCAQSLRYFVCVFFFVLCAAFGVINDDDTGARLL